VNKDQLSQAEEAWDFSFQGHSSEVTGARDGCSSSGDESMAEPGATGERKPPLAPDASELLRSQDSRDLQRPPVEPVRESLVECSSCSPQRLSDDQPITSQAKGLEPPRVPVEGRGEKGGGGEGFGDSKASPSQNTGERGSTTPLEAHVCSKTLENDVPPARESYYAHYVAQTHKASANGDSSGVGDEWSMAVPDIPEGASAMEVLRTWREYRDEGFQSHFYRPPEPVADPEAEISPEIEHRPEGVQLELFCSRWATVGHCEEGHTYAKELICNREWCSECGGTDGKAHQRRKAKWLPRVRQMSSVGYMVITVPPECRDSFHEKQQLREFGIAIKRLMQREGFNRGLRRYHWFGEDHEGDHTQGDGMPPFHPHLNLLLEAGWIDELCPDEDKATGDGCRGPGKCLSRIKRSVGRILKVDLARVNLYYEYATDVPQILHIMNYVLRPTFSNWRWDEPLAYEIHGFRHSLTWGNWEDAPVWEIPPSEDVPSPEIESLERGLCPHDDTPITWNAGVMNTVKMLRGKELGHWREIGEGYFEWSDVARAAPN